MDGKRFCMFAIALLLLSTASAVASTEIDAAGQFKVTDGTGHTFRFDNPAEHVMTIGVGVTASVIGVGALDEIVVCDSYSKTNKSPVFDGLRERISEGKVAAGGNLYSSGKEQLKIDVINAADTCFDRNSDVVFVTGSTQYRNNIVPVLEELGFRYVLQWDDITEYGDIIDFVRAVSMVCNGTVSDSVKRMEYVTSYVAVQTADIEKAEAFYVTYSAGAFKVGNVGSLANSMIKAAGGASITEDPSKPLRTYEDNITMLVEEHPDVIIFIDNSIASSESNVSALRLQTGDDVPLVPLDPLWNNYCIESTDGMWTMACAMYPELFDGDVPYTPSSESDSTLFIVAGIAVVFIGAIIGLYYVRH